MSVKDEAAALHDIRAAAGRMRRYVAGLDKKAFLANDEKCYAVLAQLIIIGEAANRLPESVREAAEGIPWRQMIGTRNRVVHGYDAIDWNIVWDIATIHGPALEKGIDSLLSGRTN
jgi:uncharacterized protein with HEPN domain